MINLFCKVKIDDSFIKFGYIELNLNISKIEEKINDKLLFMVDGGNNKKVIGLVNNKNSNNCYIVKIISEVEVFENSRIISELRVLNEVMKIDTKEMITCSELWIETISEYITVCKALSCKNTLYRGQANKEWSIEPGVFRNNSDINKEKDIYRDLLQWNSEVFIKDDLIQGICNMQHYGIPTRLMDWTSNPLYALYFGVESRECKNDDGVIFNIIPDNILEVDEEANEDLNIFLEKRYNLNYKFDKTEFNRVLENLISTNKEYLFFKAIYSNDRIKAQQGYFSVYIDIKMDEYESIVEKKYILILEEIEKYINEKFKRSESSTIRGLIHSIKKGEIKRELGQNLKQCPIFEEIKSNIKTEYRLNETDLAEYDDKVNTIIENSKIYKIKDREHCMSNLLKNESYVKIIIKKDLKEMFLKELDILGINSRVVYPDIQGLVQYIKEKYK